jgi:hypothetical protein
VENVPAEGGNDRAPAVGPWAVHLVSGRIGVDDGLKKSCSAGMFRSIAPPIPG